MMDIHHDFCYIETDDDDKGEWVVANLWRDPNEDCGPDNTNQDMHE